MIRPNHHLMKRGTLLPAVLREDQPVVAIGGFIGFFGFCPAAVSVSETVFLCPRGPLFN